MLIKISYNPDEEMMHIEGENGTLFYGNYWDFKHDPQDLYKLFVNMGLPVMLDKDLLSIG